jgi:hypothetical protein
MIEKDEMFRQGEIIEWAQGPEMSTPNNQSESRNVVHMRKMNGTSYSGLPKETTIHEDGTHSQANIRIKLPPQTLENGVIYTGEWMNGQKDGFGIQVWPDGTRYEGIWSKDKANGRG